jgi:hypothetical protein
MKIEDTLETRETVYGSFFGVSCIAQDLKAVMRTTENWAGLSPDQQESLEMIANKIGRILNGDPDYHDSWFDIQGYAALISMRLGDFES